jgi:hypothetical protein
MDAIERYLVQELKRCHDQISGILTRGRFDPWSYRKWKREAEAIEKALTSYTRSRELSPATRRRLPRAIQRKLAELESAERAGRDAVTRSRPALARQRPSDRRRAARGGMTRTARSGINRARPGPER